ncbi:hypothetical protein AGIG_G1501 [Arapaima gigas]
MCAHAHCAPRADLNWRLEENVAGSRRRGGSEAAGGGGGGGEEEEEEGEAEAGVEGVENRCVRVTRARNR